MTKNFIDDLVDAVKRCTQPEIRQLTEVLIISGMPENTQNLRYLSYNRHEIRESGKVTRFSAVAVLNNRRVQYWRLAGYSEKISRLVFHTRWTRNPLDLFLNNLRCHNGIMDLLGSVSGRYTLLGLLETEDRASGFKRVVQPVIATPGLDNQQVELVAQFEKKNALRSAGIPRLSLYRPIYS